MLFDWFTALVQLFNFLVLILLLRKFLYGPIMNAMETRRQRTVEEMDKARQMQDEAERARDSLRRKREKLQECRDDIIEKARSEADEERERMIEKAKTEAKGVQASWMDSIRDEQDDFFSRLKSGLEDVLGQEFDIALQEMADTDLTERMAEVFLSRIKTEEAENEVRTLLQEAEEPVELRYAHELSENIRTRISDALQEIGGASVEFSHAPSLVAGIELKSGSRVISWNVARYADTVRDEMRERMDARLTAMESKNG